ncbi:MAG: TIM barrel protein [Thermotogae bacterium]|nr:TIM barrel protein [Thermotogota bacterium]
MTKYHIALQLYSIRHDCEKNLKASLEAVSKMGYEAVELAGDYGKTANEWKSLLSEFGLKVAGAHVPIQSLLENFKKTVDFYKTIGAKYIIVPALPVDMVKTKEDWLKIVDTFNQLSEKLEKENMKLGYHNHMMEFQKLENNWIWCWLFDRLNPNIVMQLDTGNAMHAGLTNEDLIRIIEKYPNRAVTIHLKEYSSTNDKALIGEGDIDFVSFTKACEENNEVEWYIIEQESYAYEPLECAKISLNNLIKMLS